MPRRKNEECYRISTLAKQDLFVRFLLNLPESERHLNRVFYHLETAFYFHWDNHNITSKIPLVTKEPKEPKELKETHRPKGTNGGTNAQKEPLELQKPQPIPVSVPLSKPKPIHASKFSKPRYFTPDEQRFRMKRYMISFFVQMFAFIFEWGWKPTEHSVSFDQSFDITKDYPPQEQLQKQLQKQKLQNTDTDTDTDIVIKVDDVINNNIDSKKKEKEKEKESIKTQIKNENGIKVVKESNAVVAAVVASVVKKSHERNKTNDKDKNTVWNYDSVSTAYNAYLVNYKYNIPVAGAIVCSQNHILLVLGNGSNRWGIPKGKQNRGEPLFDSALREVEEETGVKCDAKVQSTKLQIFKNKHIFSIEDDSFKTKFSNPSPKCKEEISEVKWWTIDSIKTLPLTALTADCLAFLKTSSENNEQDGVKADGKGKVDLSKFY